MTEPNEAQGAALPETDQPPVDHLALAYRAVRNATRCNPNIAPPEALAVLEQVKFEILRDNQGAIDVALLQDAIESGGETLG